MRFLYINSFQIWPTFRLRNVKTPFVTHKKLKILLAEDEPSIREILSELIIDEGHECISATDGLDASEKVMKETFDLLITDFHMPRMNGALLYKWCREKDLKLPFIFITANQELYFEDKLGFSDVNIPLLKKPIDFNNLIEVIAVATSK